MTTERRAVEAVDNRDDVDTVAVDKSDDRFSVRLAIVDWKVHSSQP